MGPDRRHAREHRLTGAIAQVVPDLPTFAVDDGFSYEVPAALDGVVVGSLVRVPLGGRRVRGFVVGLREGDVSRLKPIQAVSGDFPVFDRRLLETLRWAATHYVAPVPVLLGKCAPPNLARRKAGAGRPPPADAPEVPPPLQDFASAAAAGRHPRTTLLVGSPPYEGVIASLAHAVVEGGRSVLVVCPTVVEAESMAAELRGWLGERVLVAASALPAAATTRAWVTAQAPGAVVVGTREVVFWPVAALGLAVLVGDGRRGLRDRQTPTTDAREILRRRAAVERFAMALVGAVPTSAALSTGPDVVRLGARPWPLVEVVDRRAEPAAGFVTPAASRALRATVAAGGRAFVFVRARGYAPAFRCARCRALRRCPGCGARAERNPECSRCGTVIGRCPDCGGGRFEPLGAGVGRVAEELGRLVPGGDVDVGTERDLVGLPPVDLAVVVDADGLMLAPHYRGGEDALRLLARVASAVRRGGGRRCMVQTSAPEDPVVVALRRGEPLEYLHGELAARAADGFPPAGELIVVETEDEPPSAAARLAAVVGGHGVVLGPAEVRGRRRWLLQGRDLRPARVALRGLVQDWREGGTRVRIDADPLDL